jgi:catechol 2,3-dioxygenase-like lactoylglutathione lyase family enzyme
LLSHVHIGVTDFARAVRFYTAVMAVLDVELRFCDPAKSWAGWRKTGISRPLFPLGKPFDGEPASPGNGQMTALLAPSRAAVDRAYAIALEQGASSEGEPGLRPQYHPDYYGAYFHDLDGNKICICCHDPVN